MMNFSELYKYRYYIVIGLGVVLSGLIGWLSWGYYDDFQNRQAEEELYPYRYRLSEAEKKSGGQVFESDSSFFALKKSKDIKSFSKELSEYKNFLLSKNSYRVTHWIAAIELSYFLIQYDQEKEALSLLEQINRKSPLLKGWVYHGALYHLGVLLINQKKYQRALNLFSRVVANENSSAFHQEALLKMAFCYEEMGEKDQALKIYQGLARSESLYKERSIHYDRLLQIKSKVNL